MKEYMDFAYIYDSLTKDVEYKLTADYIEKIFEKYSPQKPEIILDLACGTGTMCNILSDRGYDMIGVDSSYDMLNVAMEKKGDRNILYLNQDASDFELYGTVDAIVCLLDSLNYITDEEDLKNVFKWAHNYLNPGGLFIFDVNTLYKFDTVLSDNTYTFDTDDIYYVWENDFDKDSAMLDMYLTFFVKDGDTYTRFDEQHTEKYHSDKTLDKFISLFSFEKIGIFDERTFEKPNEKSQRIFYILRKNI